MQTQETKVMKKKFEKKLQKKKEKMTNKREKTSGNALQTVSKKNAYIII